MANYVSESTMAESGGRKKLTPEMIYETLKASQKGYLYGGLIFSLLLLFLCGLFVFVLSIDRIFTEEWTRIIKTILWAIPVIWAVCVLIGYHRRMKNFPSQKYSIITDTVERVVTDDKMKSRYRRGRGVIHYMEHAMYLYRCGRVVISLEETYTNSEGDVYYVVINKKHPNTPLLLYNAKFYELEDLNMQ